VKLANKRILITGGGSGIGLELARQLAAANDVVIAGRTTSKLHAARNAHPKLRVAQLDVVSEDSAAHLTQWLASDLHGLDLLVNNAGVLHGGPVAAPDAATAATDELDINLGGAIRMTRLALPLLQAAPEAGIVFVSSAVALTATPGLSVYAATKAGLHSFARSLRAELAGTSVRVYEAIPPVVDTDMTQGLDVAKVPASTVAEAIVAGITRGQEQIPIAQIRALLVMARLSPRMADGIVQRALRPRRAAILQLS
jgi:short-subunit dehydrogenase involved in D-alanine esterification of teichoic acids